jgi:cell division septum initiation protein DivIVA
MTTLEMALVGYQLEKQKIEERIREIQARLKGYHSAPASPGAGEKKAAATKRVLSPAARKRIAAAQRKRWAEHRKRLAAQAKAE